MFVFIRLEMSDKKITIKNPKNHEFVNEVGTAGLQHMVCPPKIYQIILLNASWV